METCLASYYISKSLHLADIDNHRLAFAKQQGADEVYKVEAHSQEDLANEIRTSIGCYPDVSLECSGSDDSFSTAIYVSLF